jgi:osmotically-inducible protein OsmY
MSFLRPPALRLIAGILLATAALGACAVFQDKTLGQSFDETNASTQIRTRLLASGGPNHFGEVDVEVEDRFVLLSGRVPSEEDRRTAERIAWSINIVDEVADELVVEQRNVKRDVNDVWIGQQVRARLLAARKVNSVNYNVQVYDGNVYLLGRARTDEELRTAAEQASVVRGVKKVVSYVKVRGPAPRPGEPGVPEALAGAPASAATSTAPAKAPTRGGPVQIAPPADTAAPIVPPDRQPTTRQNYSDPYANGATPPPGRNTSNGLTSQPLPPVQ